MNLAAEYRLRDFSKIASGFKCQNFAMGQQAPERASMNLVHEESAPG
jgi:hypothetical protein